MSRTRRVAAVLAIALLAALLPAASASAAPRATSTPHLGRRVVVRYRPGTSTRTRLAIARTVSARRVGQLGRLGVDVLAPRDPAAAVESLRQRTDVMWASREVIAKRLGEVQNTQVRSELALDHPDVVAARTGDNLDGTGVRVAVIDDGVWNTKDLCRAGWAGGCSTASNRLVDKGNCSGTVCFNTGAVDADAGSHGTAVATLIAATDDATGIVGVAPDATIWAYRVFPDIVSGASDIAIANAVMEAANDGADVANLSLGTPFDSPLLRDAFAYARATRPQMVIVAASGNDGGVRANYPAGNEGVLSVGASERGNDGLWRVAGFSTRGDVDVLAPGTGLRSWYTDDPGPPPMPDTTNTVGGLSGTSFAAPLVSGMLAALAGAGITGDAARATLVASAEEPHSSSAEPAASGNGRVDMLTSLRAGTGSAAYTAVFVDRGSYLPRSVGRRRVEAIRVDPVGGIDAAPVITTDAGTLAPVSSDAPTAGPRVVRRSVLSLAAGTAAAGSDRSITVATGDDAETFPVEITYETNGVEGLATSTTLPPAPVNLNMSYRSMHIRTVQLVKGQWVTASFIYPPDSLFSLLQVWSPAGPGAARASDAPWLVDTSGNLSGQLSFQAPRSGVYAVGIQAYDSVDNGVYTFGLTLTSPWRLLDRR